MEMKNFSEKRAKNHPGTDDMMHSCHRDGAFSHDLMAAMLLYQLPLRAQERITTSTYNSSYICRIDNISGDWCLSQIQV